MNRLEEIAEIISGLDSHLHSKDFLLTWEQSAPEIRQTLLVAEGLKWLRDNNYSTKVFETGIGVSQFPGDTSAFWECVKFADVALYQAKDTGRNRVIRFDPEMWDSSDY